MEKHKLLERQMKCDHPEWRQYLYWDRDESCDKIFYCIKCLKRIETEINDDFMETILV